MLDVGLLTTERSITPPRERRKWGKMFAVGAEVKAKTITAWKRKPIHEGQSVFRGI